MNDYEIGYFSTLGLFTGKACAVCELSAYVGCIYCTLLKRRVDSGGTCNCWTPKPLPEDREDDMEGLCYG